MICNQWLQEKLEIINLIDSHGYINFSSPNKNNHDGGGLGKMSNCNTDDQIVKKYRRGHKPKHLSLREIIKT